jgi:hypothetical protein
MDAVGKKFISFAEAEEWDIQQQLEMTPYERRAAAVQLRIRVYGKAPMDVREAERRGDSAPQ